MEKYGILILILLIILLVLFFLRSYYERRTLEVNEYIVASEKLPEAFDGFVCVFLSDLHDASFGKDNSELIRLIRTIDPDVIFSGGGMTSSHPDRNRHPFEAFQKIIDAFPEKVFYCANGNHEMRIYRDKRFKGWRKDGDALMKRPNVVKLQDSFQTIKRGGEEITVGAVEIEEKYYKKKGRKLPLDEGYIERHLKKECSGFTILLCHSPLYMSEMLSYGASLVLSGHFHGGTVRLPLLGGVMTPQYQFFSPLCKGRIDENGGTGIISGGLGTHSINIRFNNKPDVVKIVLKKG